MAVIVKYVVVRNGEEKMTFATKKEADAHDKMLDIADNLYDFLGLYDSETPLDDDLREALSLYLAKNSDQVMSILKGIPLKRSLVGSGSAKGGNSETEASSLTEKKKGGKSKSSKESNLPSNKDNNKTNSEG